MRKVYSRVAAVLVLLAITSQAAAAPVRERDRDPLSIFKAVKRLVLKAFDQLGCPPG